MTDKELLELAAKAVGFEICSYQHGKANCYGLDGKHNFHWNPLVDDGDALRLAVKLGLAIHVWGDEVVILNCANNFESKIVESITDDGQASTRRAIVRIAAEIGKGMK